MGSDGTRAGSLGARFAATTRVLAFEDEPDIADFLRAYFRAAGYDFVHSDPPNVAEALEAIARQSPDCVLLDINLRGFSGLEVYRRIRSTPALTLMPVIVVTANAAVRGQVAATASGIDGFVQKPFNANNLATLVEERLVVARRLADAGADDLTGVLTSAVLDARLADEIGHARATGQPFTFGLVSLRNPAAVRRVAGDDSIGWLLRTLATEARDSLPPEIVVARTDTGELAVVAPSSSPDEAAPILEVAIERLGGTRKMPGGESIPVELSCGLAGFPENATEPDGLFMAADAALADARDQAHIIAVAL